MEKTIEFRQMVESDWDSVADIYRQGIATGNATFQQDAPTWAEWDASHLKTGRIVATFGGQIAGWAALTPVSGRCVYAGVAEVSVYVGDKYRGQKMGLSLLEKLILESERAGLWTLQAGIFPENTPSIKIHEAAGFRRIGYREKIGKMNGVWRDNLMLEKRSQNVGIN